MCQWEEKAWGTIMNLRLLELNMFLLKLTTCWIVTLKYYLYGTKLCLKKKKSCTSNLALRALHLCIFIYYKIRLFWISTAFVVYLSQVKCHHFKLLRQNLVVFLSLFHGRRFFKVWGFYSMLACINHNSNKH